MSVIDLALLGDWPACVSAAVSRPLEAATAGGPHANTALHLAAQPANGASATVVAALAAAWPAAALTRNALGNTPLHAAAKWGAPADVLAALLAAPGGAAAAAAAGEDGALPLELALRRGADSDAARALRAALLALVAPAPEAAPDAPANEAALAAGLLAQLERSPRGDAPAAVCLLGSSVLAHWPGPHAAALAPPGALMINIAVPGSHARHLAAWAPPLLARLAPRVLLLYAGGNDVADGASGAAVGAAIRALLRSARAAAPCARAVVVGVMLAPAKLASREVATATLAAGEALRAAAAAEGATFVDPNVRGLLLAPDSSLPRRELFVDDGLHLSAAGYDALRALLRQPVADAWAAATSSCVVATRS